jgi:hypothetical protein
VSDFVKVHVFTSNLQHEIGTEVRYKKPTNFTTAIQIESEYENSKKVNQSTEINFIKQRSHESNMNKQKTCYYCKKNGNIKTECRKFNEINKNKPTSTQQIVLTTYTSSQTYKFSASFKKHNKTSF